LPSLGFKSGGGMPEKNLGEISNFQEGGERGRSPKKKQENSSKGTGQPNRADLTKGNAKTGGKPTCWGRSAKTD